MAVSIQSLTRILIGPFSSLPTYVFGRPAGIVMAHDGALLMSDDANGIIYRIAYPGRAAMSRAQ